MVQNVRLLLLAAVVPALFAGRVSAEEFRIYTRVYRESAGSEKPQLAGRSLSLFHAGKVYDYVPEGEQEVIIFEPAHNRFTILSTRRQLATTLHFDEIGHLLKLARREIERRIAELEGRDDPRSRTVAASLRFQSDPQFDEQYDRETRKLTLSSPRLKYAVRCADAGSPEIAESYARYADWICRLNFVLHPRVLLPEPRLKLNESLRREGTVPEEVVLRAELDAPLHLRAEHKIWWSLDAKDRSLIHDWESTLRLRTTRWVTFHEYQQAVTTGEKARR
jgi:hypothetical protein